MEISDQSISYQIGFFLGSNSTACITVLTLTALIWGIYLLNRNEKFLKSKRH